jgi:HEAT repeat protein
MNPKLLLKVFPVVLLMVVQIVGMGGVARSQGRPLVPQVQVAKESIPELIKLLKHSDVLVRSDAAGALGRIGESAIPSLIPLLKDRHGDVRWAAARVLGRIGESAIPSLIPLSREGQLNVR